MAKNDFILSVGDDNVVLVHVVDGKVGNAWLSSPDSAMAQEELGEALAKDPKAKISILIDTLDQSFKDEELPRVGILDRRKLLARHISMAFPGANLRGARLVQQASKKTLTYEMASVPLDGRIPGWLDFVQSLPHEKGTIHVIAAENVDMLAMLAPKDIPAEEGKNHWRHLIGVNVTGGLRQIIEKNGRLCLTRLTQAPPSDTPPADFADMIARDFKATITYIRRLGYQVGESLDLVVLTTSENKAVLEDMTWDGARSVSVYTPYEAGALLGLGAIGREDQAYCDVLHAAWFAHKRKPVLPLTRTVAMGDVKDDIRELAYLISPYAAAVLVAGFLGWAGWTAYELNEANGHNDLLQSQLTQLQTTLSRQQSEVGGLPYTAAQVRNVVAVADALEAGRIDIAPILTRVAPALESDAIILRMAFTTPQAQQSQAARGQPAGKDAWTLDMDMRLAAVISSADEAVQTARRIETRLLRSFGEGYRVTMLVSPVAAQAAQQLQGGLGESTELSAVEGGRELFYASYRVEHGAQQ